MLACDSQETDGDGDTSAWSTSSHLGYAGFAQQPEPCEETAVHLRPLHQSLYFLLPAVTFVG